MLQLFKSSIDACSIHFVGNKNNDEGVIISASAISLSSDVERALFNYFLKSFIDKDNFSGFYHNTDITLNEVYNYSSKIFDDPNKLHEQSVNIAKHLYEQSNHPKIKGGEFYVVYFRECILNGETVDAIGLFKSENKDTFLKIHSAGNYFELECQNGININKLDKGCLIFNTKKDDGYVVAVVDNANRGIEAHYWFDDFLQVKQRKDQYYNTENVIKLTRNFVEQELPKEFDISGAEQSELLNKTAKFFKEKDSFDIEEFANEVIAQPEVIDSFNRYKGNYQQERDIEIADNFTISETAVKKQSRLLKSVIKLDKNFHIYVHGNNQYIKKGYDESTGLYFYQLFFKEELQRHKNNGTKCVNRD